MTQSLLCKIEFDNLINATKLSDIFPDTMDIKLSELSDDIYKAEDILRLMEFAYKRGRKASVTN